ncbi:hypothetical protein [Jiangella endophytica]|uniref:hypothetical protein n=1 Tax=Jiangella endophytica TaxID=1623398 RepID=UPI000E3554EE|nr:hypothetical protein [Jiangella endophytica]
MSPGGIALLLVLAAFLVALAILIPIRVRKRQKLEGTAAVMADFAARNGMRFGRSEPNLPARAPSINDIVGDPLIYLDFHLDGTLRDVPFQAFQVRRPPPRQHAITFEVSTRTPEYTVVLVPRPVAGPPLRLAPQRLSWATVLRRDTEVGDPRFDEVFHVSTDTPDFARLVLRPPLTSWLVSDPRATAAIIVFEPAELMAVVPGPLTPDGAMSLADLMTDLRHRVPWQSLTS